MLAPLPNLRATDGSIGSIFALLGVDRAVPDHITPSCPAETLDPRVRCAHDPVHLRIDSHQPAVVRTRRVAR